MNLKEFIEKEILYFFDEKFVAINKETKEEVVMEVSSDEIKDFIKASLSMYKNEIIRTIENEAFDNKDEWWVNKDILEKLKYKEEFRTKHKNI